MNFPAGPPPSRLWLLLLLLPTLGALFGAYVLVAPVSLGYTVSPEAVEIEAGLGLIDDGASIPRAEIEGIERIHIEKAHRRYGTAMTGYCAGAWSIEGIGDVSLATDCSADVLLLRTQSGPWVISPPDLDGFLAAVQDPNGQGSFIPTRRPHPTWMSGLALLLAALPLSLGLLFRMIFRPLVYRIEGSELIAPRHYGVLRLPLQGVHIRRADLGRAFRMAGTGMPGLWLGAYRDGQGGFHACGTRRDRGLMVEASRRVYITPTDMDGFLTAAVEAGARVEEEEAPPTRGHSGAQEV